MVYLPIAGVFFLVLWPLLLPASISAGHAVLRVRAERSARRSSPPHYLKTHPQQPAHPAAESDAEGLAA